MASQNISFKQNIDTRIPGRYSQYDADQAVKTLPTLGNKMIVIGQKTSSGIATDTTAVQIFSEADAILYGGQGSVVALTSKAILENNQSIDLSLITMSDAGGSAASVGTLTIVGDSTTAGNVDVWIGNMGFNTAVNALDSSNAIASAIESKISEKEHLLPVSVAVSANVITLTARNKGTLGNNIGLSYKQNEMSNAGVTITAVQPTGGSGDPSVEDALDAIFSAEYDIVVSPLNDDTNIGLLKTYLGNLDAPTEGRREIGVFGNTSASVTTIGAQCGTTINFERLTCGYHPYDNTTPSGHSLDYEVAGAYAGVISSQGDPVLPLNDLALIGIAPHSIEKRLSRSQKDNLLENGVTPLYVGTGETVRIVRAITTYTTNSSGIDDITYLDLGSIRGWDYVTKSIETRQGLVFNRSKIMERTPDQMKAQILDVLFQMEKLGIVEQVMYYKDGIIVERDLQSPTQLNCRIPSDIVNGLMVIANVIELHL